MERKIILASRSPRRIEILSRLGLPFDTIPSSVDEIIKADMDPVRFATETALLKADEVARKNIGRVVVGADTIIAACGKIVGKPHTNQKAREILGMLNGKSHRVITGVAVREGGRGIVLTGHKVTVVRFCRVSEERIEEYALGGEPLDKAGGYAIQGEGRFLLESVKGCYLNVVGLPLCLLAGLLVEAGIEGDGKWDAVSSVSACCSAPPGSF